MKKSSKIVALLMVLILSVLSMAVLVGCVDRDDVSTKKTTFYFVNQSIDNAVKNEIEIDKYLGKSLLDLLKSEKGLKADIIENEDGVKVTRIMDLVPNLDHQYIAIYTTISEIADETVQNINIDNKTFYPTNQDLKDIKINKDIEVLFAIKENINLYFSKKNLINTQNITLNFDKYQDKYLIDVLKNEKQLKAEIDETGMLKNIMELNPDSSYQFISIYTTNKEIAMPNGVNLIHKGIVFYPANLGLSDIKITKQLKIAFVLMNWQIPTNPISPITADNRLNGIVCNLRKDIEPIASQAENINAITRAGYDLGDSFYNDFKVSVAQYMVENGDKANLKIVENSIQVLLYKGIEVPKEVIDFINRDKWDRGFSVRFSVGIILPAVTELVNAGYSIDEKIEEKLVGELLATIENDVITTPHTLDDVGVTAIALAPYAKDNEKIKIILENTAKDLVSKITDKVYDNICTISYILKMCVEFDYYGITHELNEKKMYDSIINKQDNIGNIGQIFENVQGLQGLLSYQRYYNGDGGTYFRVAKLNL